jgi:hypothetical protein
VIYLLLAVAAQVAAGMAFTCAGDECAAVPEGLAGVYFVLALLALSLVFNLLLIWRGLPLRRVWVVGCLSSAVALSIYGVKAGIPRASGVGWLYLGIGFAVGVSPLWSLSWLGLFVGEVLRRARVKDGG